MEGDTLLDVDSGYRVVGYANPSCLPTPTQLYSRGGYFPVSSSPDKQSKDVTRYLCVVNTLSSRQQTPLHWNEEWAWYAFKNLISCCWFHAPPSKPILDQVFVIQPVPAHSDSSHPPTPINDNTTNKGRYTSIRCCT